MRLVVITEYHVTDTIFLCFKKIPWNLGSFSATKLSLELLEFLAQNWVIRVIKLHDSVLNN